MSTDGDLLALMGTDGEKWARQWFRINPLSIDANNPRVDLDAMRGWFANAIEAGRSAGQAEARAEIEELRAERAAVIDVVNIYGDETLHGQFDAAGLLNPTSTPKGG